MSVTGGGDWKDALYAVQDGNVELVKYHLSEGIDVNYQHPEAFTTLLIDSVEHARYDIMQLLLEGGADPLLKEGFSAETAIDIAKKKKDKKATGILKKYLPKKKFRIF